MVKKRRGSPPDCPHCGHGKVHKHGSYYRSDDSRSMCRYRCNGCLRTFSRAIFSDLYRHKHRRLTSLLNAHFAESGTVRGASRRYGIHIETVLRRLKLLAKRAEDNQQRRLEHNPAAVEVTFDDLITFEHSKMKPLAVTIVADSKRWIILGFSVAQIPASGLLAKKSREKYGPRPNHAIQARQELLGRLKPYITEGATFTTDRETTYGNAIKQHFPDATHVTHPGGAAAIVGQGEMKKSGFDSLFCINHLLAMARAQMSRLVRRTWNTTKDPVRLAQHMAIFADYYNQNRCPRSGKLQVTGEPCP